jgi:hypothetical protein
VVAQVFVVILYRLGQAVGWPVPVGVLVIAGYCFLRRRQRRRLRERR